MVGFWHNVELVHPPVSGTYRHLMYEFLISNTGWNPLQLIKYKGMKFIKFRVIHLWCPRRVGVRGWKKWAKVADGCGCLRGRL